MARPKKQQIESRGERVTLRLLPTERAQLAAQAEAAGLTLSEFARVAALGQVLTLDRAVPVAAADPHLVIAINRIGVNLNQIARGLNTALGFVPDEVRDTLVRINSYLDQVQG